ncbi:MAG: hypothetical protein JNK56_10745 [Myxococcales bacterium]|nr:hypothetical protein [Myxococcales bacterium]
MRFCYLLLLLPTLACGSALRPTATSDEFDYIEDNAYAAQAVGKLAQRAPFDFDCPAPQMTYKKLGSVHDIGVTGCGKRATYRMSPMGYVLNSQINVETPAAPAAEAPPAAEAAPAAG